MAARVAALALALFLQAALSAAAPQCSCSCASPEGSAVAFTGNSGSSFIGGSDIGSSLYFTPSSSGSSFSVPSSYGSSYSGVSSYVPSASYSPSVPVGSPSVVSRSYGTPSSYTTSPSCRTSAYEVPVQSSTSAVAGPVSEESFVNEGCCPNSCAATRSRCSGTTKKVIAGSPIIVDKRSSTSSAVTPVGTAVTSRTTKAGTPHVSTQVYPASPSHGYIPSHPVNYLPNPIHTPCVLPTPVPIHTPCYKPYPITPVCSCAY